MRIAVLDCVAPDPLVEKHGPAGFVVAKWLGRHLPEAEMTRIDLPAGDALPAPADFDGFAITGSEKGVYDDTHWMGPLRDFLVLARQVKRPVFGICFGHQIMADVWDGEARKVETGLITGARRFEINGAEIEAHVAHQDQVTQIPPGATVIASAPYCPVAGLAYDFPALSVQFHPEYDQDYANDIIDLVGEISLIGPAEVAAAKASLQGRVAADLYSREAAAFFRAHVGISS